MEGQKTKLNRKEAAGVLQVAKELKDCVSLMRDYMGDEAVMGLPELVGKVCLEDEVVEENRLIDFRRFRHLLEGFEFNPNMYFYWACKAPYVAPTINADRTKCVLGFPAFDPKDFIVATMGTTHFSIGLVVCLLSDFMYEERAAMYLPFNGMG